VPLRLGTDCVLIPDLLVTRSADEPATDEPATGETATGETATGETATGETATGENGDAGGGPEILDAADALMVIEVVGADHGAFDRSFKPQIYARGHIPYSLLVDHEAPFAVANMIIGGRYHEYAHAATAEALRVEEPFALEIDLAAATVSPDAGRAGG